MNEKEYLEFIEQWKEENKKLIESGKCRKTFIENLPHLSKTKINWQETNECKLYFIYNDIIDWIKIIYYDRNSRRLLVEYNNKQYSITTSNFIYCRFKTILGIKTSEFKIEIGTYFKNNNQDLIITDRKIIEDDNGHKWKKYKYKCCKCGYDEGWMNEGNIKKGYNCSCCTNKTIVYSINSIADTDTWALKYFYNIEESKIFTRKSHTKIKVKCPDCGKIRTIAISELTRRKSISCSCSDKKSYPSKFTFYMLNQLHIKFEEEKVFDWCKYIFKGKERQGRYDFYFELNNKEYIVETDGRWHNEYNNLSGQTAEESKEIDNYKDRLAKEHGIEVIRIDCELSDLDYIKNNILKDKRLNELFDLSQVNWLKCHEYALSNLVKVACDYKRDNSNFTTGDISKIMNIGIQTIRLWLKQGGKLNWCVYNPSTDLSNSSKRNGKASGKPIKIFKNGIDLGMFESSAELERVSEKLFGVKLIYQGITSVCRNKLKYYKGFTFRYLTPQEIEEFKLTNQQPLTQAI